VPSTAQSVLVGGIGHVESIAAAFSSVTLQDACGAAARPPIMNEDHFLTTEEVLDYLQVNLRTVYRLIKAGKIPAVRVGRQWRFRKRDIDAWLDSSRPGRGAGGDRGLADRPRILVVDDEQAVRD